MIGNTRSSVVIALVITTVCVYGSEIRVVASNCVRHRRRRHAQCAKISKSSSKWEDSWKVKDV